MTMPPAMAMHDDLRQCRNAIEQCLNYRRSGVFRQRRRGGGGGGGAGLCGSQVLPELLMQVWRPGGVGKGGVAGFCHRHKRQRCCRRQLAVPGSVSGHRLVIRHNENPQLWPRLPPAGWGCKNEGWGC